LVENRVEGDGGGGGAIDVALEAGLGVGPISRDGVDDVELNVSQQGRGDDREDAGAMLRVPGAGVSGARHV
jgi:hypothetical protein